MKKTSLIISILIIFTFILGACNTPPKENIRTYSAAIGTSYYVSPTGLDTNPCTLSAPCKTFVKTIGLLTAGDTLYLRGGTYKERILINGKSGISGGFITIKAYSGEIPIIDGATFTASTSSGMIDVRNASYIRIDGISIINAPQAAIYFNTTNNIEIINNKTNMTKASSGIGVWWSDRVLVSNNKVENSHLYSEAQGGHEESVSIAGTTNFEVSYNEILMNGQVSYLGNAAIDCKQGARFGSVHHNYIHDFLDVDGGIYIDAWERLTGNIDIYNNRLSNNAAGVTVGSERGGTAENIRIFNNIIYNVGAAGVSIPARNTYNTGIRRNIEIYNNTIYKARWNGGAGIYITAPFIENIVIRNNIVYFNNWNGEITAGNSSLLQYIKADHNIVFGPKNCSQEYPNCVEISNNPPGYPDIYGNVTLDPKFVSLTIPDLHLQSTSPAINFGVLVSWITTDYDGKARPQGSSFDAGGYEYGTPVPTLTFTYIPIITATSTMTPVIVPTNTPVPTFTLTPVPTQECILVTFTDGTQITVCH